MGVRSEKSGALAARLYSGAVPLSAAPSRDAGEEGRAAPRTHSTPLSHTVGEGLRVRAKTADAPLTEGFVSLETPTGISPYRQKSSAWCDGILPSWGALGHRFVRDSRNAIAPSASSMGRRFFLVSAYQLGFQMS